MIPDSFDPTMMLSSAKNVGEGGIPSGEGTDSTLAQKFDSAPTAQNIVFGTDTRPTSTPDSGGPPAGVDRFSGSV